VRTIVVDRPLWTGSASDLLRLCAESARDDISTGIGWAKNPRALAGRLRRAQTFLQTTLGIEITFSREGRLGTRMIRVSTNAENSSVLPAPMAPAESSLALLGSQNEQKRLQTMLTVLTQATPYNPEKSLASQAHGGTLG
jgi:hypothetical protein